MKNNILSLLLFILTGITAFAQTSDWKWAKRAVGTLNEGGFNITTDAGGNSYVIGSFESPVLIFGSTTLTNVDNTGSSNDLFIVKYDGSGNVVWAKSAGGSKSDDGSGIVVDASGNIYITGIFSSSSIVFGGTTLTNSGNNDIFIAKYNSSGTALWAKKAGGSGLEISNSIAVDANGAAYITGVFASPTIQFGAVTLINSDSTGNTKDIFVAKYDASGTVAWAKRNGGSYDDIGTSIKVDALGNSYVSGDFYSPTIIFGSTTLTNSINTGNSNDIFIAKYDATGTILWAKQAGGASYDDVYSMCTEANGNCYVTGAFDGPIFYVGSSILINTIGGASDIFIIKYDALGKMVWAKSAGGTLSDQSSGIAVSNGNIYVTGSFSSPDLTFGSTVLSSVGNDDLFITKYDTSGLMLWAKSAGGSGGDYSNNIAADANGNLYITGLFNSPSIVFGTTTLTNSGTNKFDVFVAKYGSTTGISEGRNLFGAISIFPNPGNGQINITSSNNIDEIEITNPLGQIIYLAKPHDKNISLNLEHDGIYFVTLISGKQMTTKKIIVQH